MPQKKKKEEADLHPEREEFKVSKTKRSPGRFDQKVFAEQELLGNNLTRFYDHLFTTQQHVALKILNKQMAEMHSYGCGLKKKAESYSYLKALRNALHKKKVDQEMGRKTFAKTSYKKNAEASQLDSEGQSLKSVEEISVKKESENKSSPQSLGNTHHDRPETIESVNYDNRSGTPFEELHSVEISSKREMNPSKVQNTAVSNNRPAKCPITPHSRMTLESLSFGIMTNTLPINQLKRLVPDEPVPVAQSWPILSTYRKKTILPIVRAQKQQLECDMKDLRTRLNNYFNCEDFPLTNYKYTPKEFPKKYKILKAIEGEKISLPVLPK